MRGDLYMPLPSLRFGLVALVLPVAFLAGCGGSNHIEGTVTLDGQPVDGGTISFINTSGGSAGGQILDGKYSIESKLASGTYKVQIEWLKKTGKTIPNKSDAGTTSDETKQVIPVEYNRQSNLTAEVKSGSNTFNFELKSGGLIDTRAPGAPPTKSKAVGDN
jgi:hypothetical protein